MRRSRKTSRGGRFLAIVLAMAMVLQQAGITTLAEEGTLLTTETAATEATTEAAESNSEDTSNETTAAADSSSTTTEAASTETSTTTEKAADTEAADTSDADVTADESADLSVSSDSETTPELSIEETNSDETTTEDGSEETIEAVTEEAAEAESGESSEAETVALLESTAEATTNSFTAKNGNISASVLLMDGVLPESAQLVVETADGSYENAASLAISCAADVGITFSDYTVLDIHLEDTDGNEIDYSGSATVTLSFATSILDGDESTSAMVFHINDGAVEYLAPDTDYTNSTTGVISGITFTTTSGFSPYVIALGSYGISTIQTYAFNTSSAVEITANTANMTDHSASIYISGGSPSSSTESISAGTEYSVYLYVMFSSVNPGTTYYYDLSVLSKYLDIDTDNIPTSASEAEEITNSSSGDTLGYWYVDTTENRLYFILSEVDATDEDVWAEFYFNASCSSDVTSTTGKEPVQIPLGGDTWSGTWYGTESSLSINKETIDAPSDANSEGTYSYTVTVTSDGVNTLTTLKDVFKGQYETDSAKSLLYYTSDDNITVKLNGTALTEGTDYTLSVVGDGTGERYISITFTDGLPLSDGDVVTLTYTLTYDPSSITASQTVYNNNEITAYYTTSWDNSKTKSDKEENTLYVNHGEVSKDGVASSDYQSVTWTITATSGKSDDDYLDNYTLTDSGVTGMEPDYTAEYSVTITLEDGTSTIYSSTGTAEEAALAKAYIEALLSGSGVKVSSVFTTVSKVTGIEVVFNTKDDGKTYTSNETYTAINDVDLKDENGNEVDTGEGKVPGMGNHTDRGKITKEFKDADTTNNTATWKTTITLYPNAVLDYYEDKITDAVDSENHRFVESSSNLKITVGGVELSTDDYSVTVADDALSFIIEFDPDITNDGTTNIDVVITYDTIYDSVLAAGTYLKNSGTAYFKDDSKSAEDWEKLRNPMDKTVETYSNEDGTITWNLTIDIAEIASNYYDSSTGTWSTLPSSILITDTVPGGMKITGDISLYLASWSSWWSQEATQWVGGEQVVLSGINGLSYTETETGFTADIASILNYMVFNNYNPTTVNADNGQYLVLTYTTVVSDYAAYLALTGTQSYTNSATVTIGESVVASAQKTQELTPGTKLSKTSSFTNSTWPYATFTISDVGDLVTKYTSSNSVSETTWTTVTFIDVYGADLKYTSDTNFAAAYTTTSGGAVTIVKDDTTSDAYYTIDESTHTITFTFKADIAKTIDTISYSLYVLASSGEDVTKYDLSNSAWLEGYTETTASTEILNSASASGSQGGFSGVLLHLTKVDADDNRIVLEGATFKVYEASYDSSTKELSYNKSRVVDSETTLTNGKLTLSDLSFNQLYAIVETAAPDDYNLSTQTTTVHYIIFCKNENSVDRGLLAAYKAGDLDGLVEWRTITSNGTLVSESYTVENKKEDTAELTVTKAFDDDSDLKLSGLSADQKAKITITITNANDPADVLDSFTLAEKTEGTYSVPLNTEYVVTESSDIEGYTWTKTYTITSSAEGVTYDETAGTVEFTKDGATATVTVTNKYEEHKGSLTVTKAFDDDSDLKLSGLSAD
ncbi:MAG: hypothetical protein LUI39_04160, partial [Lachnospiraceae bacterium]|nr:hypothetical protein [Lachnospiraceae bacterium]